MEMQPLAMHVDHNLLSRHEPAPLVQSLSIQELEDLCKSDRWVCIYEGEQISIDDLNDELGPYVFLTKDGYVIYEQTQIPINNFLLDVQTISGVNKFEGRNLNTGTSTSEDKNDLLAKIIAGGVLIASGVAFWEIGRRLSNIEFGIGGHPQAITMFGGFREHADTLAKEECENLSVPLDGDEFHKRSDSWYEVINKNEVDYNGDPKQTGKFFKPPVYQNIIIDPEAPEPDISDIY